MFHSVLLLIRTSRTLSAAAESFLGLGPLQTLSCMDYCIRNIHTLVVYLGGIICCFFGVGASFFSRKSTSFVLIANSKKLSLVIKPFLSSMEWAVSSSKSTWIIRNILHIQGSEGEEDPTFDLPHIFCRYPSAAQILSFHRHQDLFPVTNHLVMRANLKTTYIYRFNKGSFPN